jgi:3-oxoadipate enol-lactonase
MPTTDSSGASIHYNLVGEGPTLLMLMGFGVDQTGWILQVPWLSKHFQCVLVDNRGIGRSEAPAGPYSMAQMVQDSLSVLDVCGIEKAHVLGLSMGGMIALNLALSHADRVDGLILACTTAHLGAFGEETIAAVGQRVGLDLRVEDPNELADVDMEAVAQELVALSFSDAMLQQSGALIDNLVTQALQWMPTPQVLHAQYAAIREHNVSDHLGTITKRTLVMTAELDQLIPPSHGEHLAAHIPHAELLRFDSAGHAINFERPKEFNQAVRHFLCP